MSSHDWFQENDGDRASFRRSASVDSCCSAQELTSAVLQDMIDDSTFFLSIPTVAPLPSFQPSDVQVGRLLGHGEFGDVLELTKLSCDTSCDCRQCQTKAAVSAPASEKKESVISRHFSKGHPPFHLIDREDENDLLSGNETEETADVDESDEEWLTANTMTQQTRMAARMAQHCVRTKDNSVRYVVKRIRAIVKLELRNDAICDLTCEAMFLSRLVSHPNIITLRATVGTPGTDSFMLVMDRLNDDLQQKIQAWRLDWQRCRGKALGLWNRDKQGLQALYIERLLAAFDIARALRHLHRHQILYRDIKPENIGVNAHGHMQLFDFGLAKELKKRDLVKGCTDKYHATGLTGSRRYMAPEVVESEPYGFGADVYSFGILLWEMVALRTPFCGYDANKHYEQVVLAAQRPTLVRSWPLALRTLLPQCWATSAADRLDILAVCQSLQSQLQDAELNSGGGEEELHISTRSRYLSSRQAVLEEDQQQKIFDSN